MNKKSIRKVVAVLAATVTSMVMVSSQAGASSATPAAGKSCTKAQYGKVLKVKPTAIQCTYNGKTKQYTWTQVAMTASTVKPIDITKLDKKGWPKKFVIGGVPAENATTMQTKWQGMVDLFKTELGIPVEFYSATSYAGVIEASISKKIDFVAWGAMSYIVAKLNGAKIEPVGLSKYVDGTTSYTSKLWTRTGSSIAGIKDLKGKKVCLVSATSTSGGLVPTEGILNAGMTLKDMTTSFEGTHDNSMLGLSTNKCEAAFSCCVIIGQSTLKDMKPAEYKQVWESGAIPNGPFSLNSTLPASFKAAVKDIVLKKLNKEYFVQKGFNGCTDVATCIIIEDKNTASITEVKDSFYDYIRAMCEATKSSSCKA